MTYQSSRPYTPERIHGAAVYCSDGRFADQCDDYLHNHLKLPNYDRLALPGGPASLVHHPEIGPPGDRVLLALRFLIEAHQLQRVALIQHQGCAFYQSVLGIEHDDAMQQAQQRDLDAAADALRAFKPDLQIHKVLARIHDQRVTFRELPDG